MEVVWGLGDGLVLPTIKNIIVKELAIYRVFVVVVFLLFLYSSFHTKHAGRKLSRAWPVQKS